MATRRTPASPASRPRVRRGTGSGDLQSQTDGVHGMAEAPSPVSPGRRAAPRAARRSTPRPAVASRRTDVSTVVPLPAETVTSWTERVRLRAYFLSVERNGSGGDALADWLRAERELAGESEPDGGA